MFTVAGVSSLTFLLSYLCYQQCILQTHMKYCKLLLRDVTNTLLKRSVGSQWWLVRLHGHYHHGLDHRMHDVDHLRLMSWCHIGLCDLHCWPCWHHCRRARAVLVVHRHPFANVPSLAVELSLRLPLPLRPTVHHRWFVIAPSITIHCHCAWVLLPLHSRHPSHLFEWLC